MVSPPLGAPLVSGSSLAATASPSSLAATVAAVRVAAVAAAAKEEERAAPAARPHPQRIVHVPVRPAGEGLDSTAETCDSTARSIHVPVDHQKARSAISGPSPFRASAGRRATLPERPPRGDQLGQKVKFERFGVSGDSALRIHDRARSSGRA